MKTCNMNFILTRVRQPQLNLKDEGYLPYSSKSSFNCLFSVSRISRRTSSTDSLQIVLQMYGGREGRGGVKKKKKILLFDFLSSYVFLLQNSGLVFAQLSCNMFSHAAFSTA